MKEKTKRINLLLAILILASTSFIWVEPAYACSCRMAHTPETAFKEYEAVFRGKVVTTFWPSTLPYNDKIHQWTRSRANSSYVLLMINRLTINTAEFEVIDAWKGVDTTSIMVKEFPCVRTTFSPGSEYIVYAYKSHGQLWVTGCEPSVVIEQSGVSEHLTYLEAKPKMPLKTGFFWLTFYRNLCFIALLVVIIGIISVMYFARKRMVSARA